MKTITTKLAKVNNVSILMIDNGSEIVPIRPICDALGIDEDVQNRKIKDDDFLSSVATLSVATGSDGKQYKMTCLPYRYIFGWLFTINPKNVKPEAQESVFRYKIECYDVLFKHYADQSEFIKQKQLATEQQFEQLERYWSKSRWKI
ncbi:MAG: phage antirepressor N-terminal domain-containing protein [Bacteroidales bacterium]